MAVERVTLQLNSDKDSDIVEYLAACGNKNGAIKRALRAQMEIEDAS